MDDIKHLTPIFEFSTLNDIGQVCQRPYIKKKSYMGLIGFLKKIYDIDLQIT